MATVVLDVTMSLDGFIAGPNVSPEHPMGEGGKRLHDWIFHTHTSEVDAEIVQEMFETTGAVVLGRTTFDVGLGEWEDTPYPVPCFVLTHETQEDLPQKSGTFTFINDVEAAYQEATEAAGDKYVRLMGAGVAQQFLAAGFVDEIRIQLAPILLGAGRRLFENLGTELPVLEQLAVIESPFVTHLRYRVANPGTAAA